MEDLTGLGKLADSKVITKAYDDALHEPMREGGKFLLDAAKAFRLFLAPTQLLAVVQDRLAAFCERVRQRVPENQQVEAAQSIAIPILLSLKYMEDDNLLTELFLNLLTRAIDKERVSEAHPAFVRIIEQLSPDEAVLLYLLRNHDIRWNMPRTLTEEPTWSVRLHSVPEYQPFLCEQIAYPQNCFMYLSHLRALDLLYHYDNPEPTLFHGRVEYRTFVTTEFGDLFIKACVPDQLPIPES